MLQQIQQLAARLAAAIDIGGSHARRRQLIQRTHYAMLQTTNHRLVRARHQYQQGVKP